MINIYRVFLHFPISNTISSDVLWNELKLNRHGTMTVSERKPK